LEVGPLNAAEGSGERCKLPQRGVEQSPSRNRILCICKAFRRSRAVASSTVAAAGGCRDGVEYDDGSDDCASCCAEAAGPVARLNDIWPPLCMLLSGGPAGVPQGRDPH